MHAYRIFGQFIVIANHVYFVGILVEHEARG